MPWSEWSVYFNILDTFTSAQTYLYMWSHPYSTNKVQEASLFFTKQLSCSHYTMLLKGPLRSSSQGHCHCFHLCFDAPNNHKHGRSITSVLPWSCRMLLNQWQLIIVWSLIFSRNIATSHKEVKTKHLTEHLENLAPKDETLQKNTFPYICFLFLCLFDHNATLRIYTHAVSRQHNSTIQQHGRVLLPV